MDSLPQQHIDSLPNDLRDEAYRQIATLLVARKQGDTDSEEELAHKAGFSSVEAMHNRLTVWGLSGLLPSTDTTKETAPRKAQLTQSEAVKLPPSKNAIPIFEEAVRWMTTEIFHVANLEESLQGGRFMLEGGGGQWFPDPDLTRLIGSCLVESGARADIVERLVEALHPNPDEANREKLYYFLFGKEGLMVRIPQIAALIRGAPSVGPGVKRPSISAIERLEKGL